ncbi:iron-containing alcohol dehydrogenase [Aestuariibaculum sp. YM273]|uniref:iron-containing alcohol dehydrogenase n=1 Tax=Aestuariibaculum sp. YM273 TaxID=3070659 RepID=UPI0027DC501D|nr:iron-containing alcohol dehydrogenase [Aestuariibaculum sp. YM273]WMI66257.1 iron-containing alcohol dehydrogenase [Aestuariibaculum sp. YM273]
MKSITLLQPQEIVFGSGSLKHLLEDRNIEKSKRILFLVAPPLLEAVSSIVDKLNSKGKEVYFVEYKFLGEPTFSQFNTLLEENKSSNPDCVIGVGGGSVLDCAKLLAALIKNGQKLEDVVGIGLLNERAINLICIPTTSGTGSEVSPNAILLNEESQAKSGIISPYLVPDACYLDPDLTISLRPKLTAETGIDALSHCIEAYTNKFAHPTVDVYALKGIELIAKNIERAYLNGNDIEARSALLLGSMYGGLCLGPVNTSAVHALSYGLGGKFHVPHGLSNAILMPEVLRFNLSANPKRHAEVARALGITLKGTDEEVALAGIESIEAISKACHIPQRLTEIGVDEDVIPELADIAMKVTRLLKNNPKEVTRADAITIYKKLL